MPKLELAGWVTVILAAVVLVAFVLDEARRYVHRARNLSRILATSRAEGVPLPQRNDTSRGRVDMPRPAGVPSLSHQPTAPPPGIAMGGGN